MKLLPFLKRVGFKEKGVMVYVAMVVNANHCLMHMLLCTCYLPLSLPLSLPPSFLPPSLSSDVHFMPVSGYNGTNLKEIDRTCCPFYDGLSFLHYLDTLSPIAREDSGPVRLPLLDKFKVCVNE